MLTEDIDSALRAYGSGKKAVHDMNVISYEMAPNTFGAFWKQRMRWTQGKFQHSIVPVVIRLTIHQVGPKLLSATSP
jgi:cellulose synthase/poly-beta-1,6-N-acetylglucosamine synthase-like glycosyltransferase